MKSLIPMLAVRDMDATMAFYTDVLGFEVTFTLPNEAGGLDHAGLKHGETDIMVGPLRDAAPDGSDRPGTGIVLYMTVADDEDIDAYFERVKAAGARVLQEPTDQFWGHRDWGIADPDGYVLYISKEVRTLSPDEMREQALAGAMAD